MRMTNSHHAEAVVEIDVVIAVDIDDVAALALLREDRERLGVLERRRHTSRHGVARPLPPLAGSRVREAKSLLLSDGQLGDAPLVKRGCFYVSGHSLSPRRCRRCTRRRAG